ncbi:SDR family oxidoreductase [Celeribacter naphthalenivorans]|uniref:SDR family oxidoreductase n=1 Tax=Celeribacter naphthalenivorans TaxID=1614694 RepID=UPI001CFB7ADB|nr:SDR family oxidoreductase [Celeribacter naphthalenivorans]
MDLGISGKRAVVIGASQGLGFAAAKSLAQEGVELVLFARSAEKLTAARESLLEIPGAKVEFVTGDISKAEDVEKLKSYVEETGGMQILVLNTPPPPRPMVDFIQETDDQRWEDAYQLQLKGALLVLRKLAPLLIDHGWGRIVAITSASIKEPLPNHALSTVFRAGVQAALKHLAMELAQYNVTVNSVAPAVVVSETYRNFHKGVDERISRIPLKRPGTLEELGATVAFFASDLAGFITGENLQVDGGYTKALI